jgi:hypothetical protein
MYRDCMDQLAREDIAAAAAAHRELGRDYDDAVAEGLVERIGTEIDRRVDARLALTGATPASAPGPKFRHPGIQPRPDQAGKPAVSRPISFGSIVLALGSMGIGIGAAGTVLSLSDGSAGRVWLVALIWVIIGVVNVSYSRRH